MTPGLASRAPATMSALNMPHLYGDDEPRGQRLEPDEADVLGATNLIGEAGELVAPRQALDLVLGVEVGDDPVRGVVEDVLLYGGDLLGR